MVYQSSQINFTIVWRGLELKGSATFYPGFPGVTSGPPEKCYPDEPPELDIHTLTHNGQDFRPLMDTDLAEEIEEAVYETLEPSDDEEPEDYDG